MSPSNKPTPPNRPPGSARPAATPTLDGIYVINKPMSISSMTAIEFVRRKAAGAKTGHTGTLDPRATGVLVLAIGPSTKLLSRLMDTDKRYRTEIDLSAFTSTDDLEGERSDVAVDQPPAIEAVQLALQGFVGRIMQRPPAFSAMKVGGKRAYRLARQGRPVDLPERPVTIHALTLVRYAWPVVELDLHCEKGVYVRSLARDLGEALGTGGHCVSIHRSAVGPFTDAMAVPLDEVPEPLMQQHLLRPEQALAML